MIRKHDVGSVFLSLFHSFLLFLCLLFSYDDDRFRFEDVSLSGNMIGKRNQSVARTFIPNERKRKISRR